MADRDVLINALLTFSNAQALYEDLPNEVRKVCRQAAEALQCGPLQQQWIPCSERMPEERGDYLCASTYPDGEQAVYERYWSAGARRWDSEFVTHWMPKPKPPGLCNATHRKSQEEK